MSEITIEAEPVSADKYNNALKEKEDLELQVEKLKEQFNALDEKAALLSNAKVMLQSQLQQSQDSYQAVCIQRNRLLEQEADTAVQCLQLQRKNEEDKKAFIEKLNAMSQDLDSVRKKFGDAQYRQKHVAEELSKLRQGHTDTIEAFEWFINFVADNIGANKEFSKLFKGKSLNTDSIIDVFQEQSSEEVEPKKEQKETEAHTNIGTKVLASVEDETATDAVAIPRKIPTSRIGAVQGGNSN